MKERTNEKQIHQWIQATIDTVGMDIELKQMHNGINMSYNFIFNNVGYDVKRVGEALTETKTPISPEAYIKALTIHELGHAVDRKALMNSLERTIEIFEMKKSYSLKEQYSDLKLLGMLLEEHLMNIDFEETAWANAENMNKKFSIVDWQSFDQVKAQGLATYHHLYQRDLTLYNKLLAGQSEQIA
ncbi:integrase [Heyndrickxia vini]|uniref:Integrase n=1 Tax=Heyndrickxia vini TaxID=1476025 RepID=A0ABX7E3R6_9BACI|nr:integrase [Heyndrickxia vini]QQZ09960.1 integrase [Heyndrickxia vini]